MIERLYIMTFINCGVRLVRICHKLELEVFSSTGDNTHFDRERQSQNSTRNVHSSCQTGTSKSKQTSTNANIALLINFGKGQRFNHYFSLFLRYSLTSTAQAYGHFSYSKNALASVWN